MNGNLLIVDDSPVLRVAIRRAAIMAGIEEGSIREAGDGLQALEALAAEGTALVLLDVYMPVMDGETFLRAARESDVGQDVPVILVTTEANRERLAGFDELGVLGVLQKPFPPEALRELIEAHIESGAA